jgi:1-acyl-sn-glycerol-3-phosphate acyltransferase
VGAGGIIVVLALPTEEDPVASRFYRSARAVSRPLVKMIWNHRVSGLENVPETGGFVIASNHLAYIDSFLIPVVIPRTVRFVAKDSLWEQKGPQGAVMRWFFDTVGAVPVDREELASGKGALQAALQILRDGDAFGIFPEGTRSKDGLLHPGKQGAAWLALESGCPVVPVGLKGTQHMLDAVPPERGTVSVRIGAPIRVEDVDPSASKGARRRLLNQRIMADIQALSGQRRAGERTARTGA